MKKKPISDKRIFEFYGEFLAITNGIGNVRKNPRLTFTTQDTDEARECLAKGNMEFFRLLSTWAGPITRNPPAKRKRAV